MNEREYLINDYFTEAEMSALMQGLDKYMYDNPYISEEGYEAANRALEKITRNVI